MSKETVEKMTVIENVTKKQVIEAIKANKRGLESPEQNTTTVQNTIQDNTSEIIEKMESKIPKYVQLYSDLYKKYLQMTSNLCTKSYLTQKEFYEKMEIGDNVRFAMFDAYSESIKKMVLLQMDITETMFQSYVGFRLTALEFYDQMISGGVINFAKMCPILNNFKK
jgi:hypothetical protein